MGDNDTAPRTPSVIDSTAIIIGDYKLIISGDKQIPDTGVDIYLQIGTPSNPLQN